VIEKFRPLHRKTPLRNGYVSLQGDPLCEGDSAIILNAGRANREVAPNVCHDTSLPTSVSAFCWAFTANRSGRE
jgi:hypothetical protein